MFQSTLPARGSDVGYSRLPPFPRLVSIHAPREGERPLTNVAERMGELFQSTLPARGSDNDLAESIRRGDVFQSTLPARGSDCVNRATHARRRCFNPRSPRGGATTAQQAVHQVLGSFNPRSPRGGATIFVSVQDVYVGVSIHAPREGERPGGCI